MTAEDKYQEFDMEIYGKMILIRYCPNWLGHHIHVEFTSRDGTSHPISETGYRSHFINGNEAENGITKKNLKSELEKLAYSLADEKHGMGQAVLL